jgi:hypothetical protein
MSDRHPPKQAIGMDRNTHSLHLRWLSGVHATNLRLWIGLFLFRDGFRVVTGTDFHKPALFDAMQLTLLCATIALAYYGLFRSFRWVRDPPLRTGATMDGPR